MKNSCHTVWRRIKINSELMRYQEPGPKTPFIVCLYSSTIIMFPSLSGSQWADTWNTCSLQFGLPRANLHWFTSSHWLYAFMLRRNVTLHSIWTHLIRLCKPMYTKRKICLGLTGQKILIVLHQVWGQHQGVVRVEGWLQLIPLWSPAPKKKINYETDRIRGTFSRMKWSTQRYLARVQQALGQVLSSKGVSSLIFWAVLIGRGSRTCSTKLP